MTSLPSHLSVTREGGVLYLGFHRPDKKNAVTRAMYAALADALREAHADPAVRVAVLHGTRGIFTAGNDLGDFLHEPPQNEDHPVFHFLGTLSTFPKPVLAAVQGPAIGIGTTALLHCDYVVAGPSARFQLPFVNLGLCPEAASSLLLPQAVGAARAAEWLLFGEPFSADDALRAGLINAVVAEDQVLATVHERAQTLAQKPPAAVRITKALLKGPRADAIAQTLRDEAAQFVLRLQSDEAQEAFTAFFERRAPDFSRFG